MADAVLFEFLHTEMVAELWVPDPDPGSGGKKTSLSVLEGLGFRVGQALGERLPRETLAFREELDALKFLCRDLWAAMFHKHMDSLRTNHQGTYVLQDNSFPLLITMGSGPQYREEAPKFLAFTCGLLCGALHTLGFRSLVTASVASLPACPGTGSMNGVACPASIPGVPLRELGPGPVGHLIPWPGSPWPRMVARHLSAIILTPEGLLGLDDNSCHCKFQVVIQKS
ncbi:trafficking protein particle complex subunit 6A isoform X2 [Apodemus sylvaticus]|uniref:trafficking protein particle complex subunit 6A isoform X2 n=1 Tax=Apodemus sylvaticus TaxID=10129 RepID=UPI0022427FEA|nr:trafficking protein particle complex subunit 6A isoform X2 [Apodemus sylvaticus]